MRPKTLLQIARDTIDTSLEQNPTYHTLNDFQREKLTAAAMRDSGAHAYEFIVESGFLESLAGVLINALEATCAAEKQQIKIQLGELLIDSATNYAQQPIDDALDNAIAELAIARHFYPLQTNSGNYYIEGGN